MAFLHSPVPVVVAKTAPHLVRVGASSPWQRISAADYSRRCRRLAMQSSTDQAEADPAEADPARPSTASGTESADQEGPRPPPGFEAPNPRTFYIRPDRMLDVALGTVASAARLGTGTFISGYRVSRTSEGIVEKTTSLPDTRPAQPLELYEFEACPFCRKVREAVTLLDLDAYYYPTPSGGVRFRPQVVEMGGKAQFPYLVDPNTDFRGYESDDIVQYLFKTYGDGRVPLTLAPGLLTNLTAGIASLAKPTAGRTRPAKTVFPTLPLELWAYEASPFCKLAREKLTELELPHLLHSAPRGSPTRAQLKERTGRFQVPYIEDPNTGVKMFESAEIIEYLELTYGPSAPGSTSEVPQNLKGISPKIVDVAVSQADEDSQTVAARPQEQ